MSKVLFEMIWDLMSNLVNLIGVGCLFAGALLVVWGGLNMILNALGGSDDATKTLPPAPAAAKGGGKESAEKKEAQGGSDETPAASETPASE